MSANRYNTQAEDSLENRTTESGSRGQRLRASFFAGDKINLKVEMIAKNLEQSDEISVVLFDLGGVLIELSGVPTMLSWVGDTMTPEELWAKWLSSPAVRAFETGRISSDDFAEQLVAEMALAVSPAEFIQAFTYWPNGLFPGALALVERISAAYTVAALSNTNALHWSRLMQDMALEHVFEHCFASHLIGKLKPDPEVFEHVVEGLNCKPGSILFIDDNWLNVKAARAVGIQAEVAQGVDGAEQVLLKYGVIE